MLGTAIQYLQAASGARVDMTLSFFMEVAFFEFLLVGEGLTRRRNLLYVAIAMAILAKGPVGLVLPAAVALLWITVQRRWDLIGDLKLARGTAIVAILAGWWYVAACFIGGKAFIEKQLIAENFVRFVGGSNFHEGHAHAFYYLEGALGAGFLPWTPILALVLWRSLRAPRKADSRLMYLVIWFVVVLGFYSFSHSKRGVYLLPLYPALATITALYLIDAIDMPASTARLVAFLSSLYGAALAMAGASRCSRSRCSAYGPRRTSPRSFAGAPYHRSPISPMRLRADRLRATGSEHCDSTRRPRAGRLPDSKRQGRPQNGRSRSRPEWVCWCSPPTLSWCRRSQIRCR